MQIDLLLAIALSAICFLTGVLFGGRARNTDWVFGEFRYLQDRIEILKGEVVKMTALYVAQKQRSAWLLGKLRAANRPHFGRGIMADVFKVHKQLNALMEEFNRHTNPVADLRRVIGETEGGGIVATKVTVK